MFRTIFSIIGLLLILSANAVAQENGDLKTKVANFVNKLNSTSQPSEQSFARNQLTKLGRDALPYLIESIKNDKRTYVRVQIAFIMGKIKDISAIPSLEKTAKSKFPALNKAAIISIGDIGGEPALSSLNRLKSSTSDTNMLRIIKETIDRTKDPEKNTKKN